MRARKQPNTKIPMQDETNSQTFSRLLESLLTSSIRALPLSLCCIPWPHMKAAKHGWDSLEGTRMSTVAGLEIRKDGSGGGGIDRIKSGGGPANWSQLPTQFPSIMFMIKLKGSKESMANAHVPTPYLGYSCVSVPVLCLDS